MTSYLFHINTFLNIVIKAHFLQEARCVYLFTDGDTSLDNFNNIPLVSVKVKREGQIESELVFRQFGCQFIVIHHVNGSAVMENFELQAKKFSDRFGARKYLFISPENNELNNLFQLACLVEVSELLVVNLVRQARDVPFNGWQESYQLLTHKFTGNDFNKRIILDYWFSSNQSFLFDNNLFPNKLGDQDGKKIVAGTLNYVPFAVVDVESNSYDGVDIVIFKEFAKKHNFSISIVEVKDFWGQVFENGSGYGISGEVAEGILDFGFGAFYIWLDPYPFVEYTIPYMRTRVSCIVPAPQLRADWFTPFYSLSKETWGATSAVFIFCTAVVFLLQTHYKFLKVGRKIKLGDLWGSSLFMMTKVFLEQSLTIIPQRVVFRLLLAVIILQALLLSTFYNSGYSSIMTVPRYEKSIKTVQDLADTKLKWAGISDGFLISIKDVEEPMYQEIISNYVIASIDKLRSLSLVRDYGFAVEQLQFGHTSVGTHIRRDVIENFRLMEEPLYWGYCSFPSRKQSVYLAPFNKLLFGAIEGGLIEKWESEVVERLMDSDIQKKLRYHMLHQGNDHTVVKLQWMHIKGAFAILLVGFLFSAVCFALELILKR